MSKTVIIFNTIKTFDKYSLEQIGLIDYSEVLGNCLWASYMSYYEDDPYINVQSYPIWEEIKKSVEKEDWSEVYKLGKKFTSKVVKTKDLEMHAECAIKSMMNMMHYDNLSAIVTSEKPKVIMQILADSINERTDDTRFAWDLKWKLASSDKENTIVMNFPNYKFKLIPCNNAYQYYNMENYYNELDFKMYDDKKLYEGKIMKKNRIIEKKDSVIDKIQDLINDTDDLSQISFDMDESEISSADDVIAYIEDKIYEIEVIYYDNAMKILSKYDPSLQESMGYADEMGLSCKDINSELLATLLCQEWAKQDLYNITDDIEEVIDEWLESDKDDE